MCHFYSGSACLEIYFKSSLPVAFFCWGVLLPPKSHLEHFQFKLLKDVERICIQILRLHPLGFFLSFFFLAVCYVGSLSLWSVTPLSGKTAAFCLNSISWLSHWFEGTPTGKIWDPHFFNPITLTFWRILASLLIELLQSGRLSDCLLKVMFDLFLYPLYFL